jgi:hypothetical protein
MPGPLSRDVERYQSSRGGKVKILAASVEWFDTFGNDPELKLLVDKIPDHSELKYESKDGLWVAYNNGYVSFYYHSGDDKNHGGFGWDTVNITLVDGTKKSLRGPWSSRAGCVNVAFPDRPVVDVCITDEPADFKRGYTFYSGHVTLEVAKQAAKLAGVQLYKRVESDGEVTWRIPKRKVAR